MGPVTTQILSAAAILAAIGTIGGALWWVIQKVLRPLAIVAEDWRGEPDRPGVPGRPGVMVQLAELRTLLGEERNARRRLEADYGSLRDRMVAVERHLQIAGREHPLVEASGTVIAERADAGHVEQLAYGFGR